MAKYNETQRPELSDNLFVDAVGNLATSVWLNYYQLPDRLRGDHDVYENVLANALVELAVPLEEAKKIAFLAKLEAQAQLFLQD